MALLSLSSTTGDVGPMPGPGDLNHWLLGPLHAAFLPSSGTSAGWPPAWLVRAWALEARGGSLEPPSATVARLRPSVAFTWENPLREGRCILNTSTTPPRRPLHQIQGGRFIRSVWKPPEVFSLRCWEVEARTQTSKDSQNHSGQLGNSIL